MLFYCLSYPSSHLLSKTHPLNSSGLIPSGSSIFGRARVVTSGSIYMINNYFAGNTECRDRVTNVAIMPTPTQHMQTRTHTTTHPRACAHARTHTPTPTHKRMHTQTDGHARMHACTHARMHACTHARMHACTHARMHACTHARMHACTHARTHTRTHAHSSVVYYKCLSAIISIPSLFGILIKNLHDIQSYWNTLLSICLIYLTTLRLRTCACSALQRSAVR